MSLQDWDTQCMSWHGMLSTACESWDSGLGCVLGAVCGPRGLCALQWTSACDGSVLRHCIGLFMFAQLCTCDEAFMASCLSKVCKSPCGTCMLIAALPMMLATGLRHKQLLLEMGLLQLPRHTFTCAVWRKNLWAHTAHKSTCCQLHSKVRKCCMLLNTSIQPLRPDSQPNHPKWQRAASQNLQAAAGNGFGVSGPRCST
jgi:hypothetical protein